MDRHPRLPAQPVDHPPDGPGGHRHPQPTERADAQAELAALTVRRLCQESQDRLGVPFAPGYKQVAKRLNVSDATAKRRLAHAKRLGLLAPCPGYWPTRDPQ
jgi:hypothetical protein